MVKLPTMNPKIVADEICAFILDIVCQQKKTGAVIGLSGGIDSTVVALLAERAFKKYKYELKAYIIPSAINKSIESFRASKITRINNINKDVIFINQIIKEMENHFLGIKLSPFDKGNMISRIRANILNTYAAIENKILLGTGNKDEDFGIGYYTLFGDGAVHCSPIGGLSKRLVYQMGKYLNVPDEIMKATPTAGLENGQTDYSDLGYGYDIVEFCVEAICQDISYTDFIKEVMNMNFKFDRDKFNNLFEVFDDIHRRHKAAKSKLKILHPPTPKITLEYK